ncbi:TonB family protein [Marivita sp. GX14005]|uniref:TonB family protein n=1 Tax=Marivita sp. GX14005 TaxID=2942276 RepID=UPI002019DF05|nr:TonB family protein [Marivita sp. GX14005]MCL3882318.1 TonB family protein [Marivita sp. GX14005]
MRIVEIAGFLSLSGALHVAALALGPASSGGGSEGAGGGDSVTLSAATPQLAAMVADWETPPEIGAAPESVPAPRDPSALVAPAAPITRPLRAEASPLPMPFQQSADLPQLDHASPSAPRASLTPQLRPKRQAEPAKPKAQSTPQTERKARGAGQGSTARQSAATRAASGPSAADRARLVQKWGAQVTSALRRAHRVPRGAGRGTVDLVLTLTPAGQVSAVSITASSGSARLDRAALAAVRLARFPPAPKGLTEPAYRFSQRLTVRR